jgi:hypothetical protein
MLCGRVVRQRNSEYGAIKVSRISLSLLEKLYAFSMLKHVRDVLRDRSRSALFNETLKAKSGSELPEFLGINKVRTSAPGVHSKRRKNFMGQSKVWGSVTCKPLSSASGSAILQQEIRNIRPVARRGCEGAGNKA